MRQNEHIDEFRAVGGVALIVRAEGLVPQAEPGHLHACSEQLRRGCRPRPAVIETLLEVAIERYGARALDNIDLSRLADVRDRARVVGRALQDRADARGFVLGRRLVDAAGD